MAARLPSQVASRRLDHDDQPSSTPTGCYGYDDGAATQRPRYRQVPRDGADEAARRIARLIGR